MAYDRRSRTAGTRVSSPGLASSTAFPVTATRLTAVMPGTSLHARTRLTKRPGSGGAGIRDLRSGTNGQLSRVQLAGGKLAHGRSISASPPRLAADHPSGSLQVPCKHPARDAALRSGPASGWWHTGGTHPGPVRAAAALARHPARKLQVRGMIMGPGQGA